MIFVTFNHSEPAARAQRRVLTLVVVTVFAALSATSCTRSAGAPTSPLAAPPNVAPSTSPTPPDLPLVDGFDYPIGTTGKVSQAKDRDPWYNAQDFTVNNHLGEDWNLNTGGDSDCGQPVYAAANGSIVYAQDAGEGWRNVVIVEHKLADDSRVQTLYGHLQEIARGSGMVKRRELLGKVGNANGRYPCHLHFELRLSNCPSWTAPGPGYSTETNGWTDPSKFIDAHRPQR